MSIIDNVHASVQGLLNRGPLGPRGPHHGGGPPQHSNAHEGANGRNFGGPKGPDLPAGVPRATPPSLGGPPTAPSMPTLPGMPALPMPSGADRPQVGQTPHGADRPNQGQLSPGPPAHAGPGGPGGSQVVTNPLSAVQGLVTTVLPRAMPATAAHAAPAAVGHAVPAQVATGMHAVPAGQVQAAAMQAGQAGGATRGELAHLQVAAPPRSESTLANPVRSDVAAGPARPDAAVAASRSDTAFMDRMAVLQRAALAPSALPANAATHTAAPAALAAVAAGATMATTATPQALPVNQAADARNVAGLTVADRGQVVRSDAMTGTYTGEGPHRRRLRRGASALPGSLSALLAAMGAQGRTSGAGQDARAIERELQAAAMQWLFWLLAIIAYGCVAFAVIGLMPPGAGTVGPAVTGRAWAGGFAIAGLLAASGAWWFARHLARGRGKAPPAAPRGD